MAVKTRLTQGGDGTAIASGMVGEMREGIGQRAFTLRTASAGLNLNESETTMTLTQGFWSVSVLCYFSASVGTINNNTSFLFTTGTGDTWPQGGGTEIRLITNVVNTGIIIPIFAAGAGPRIISIPISGFVNVPAGASVPFHCIALSDMSSVTGQLTYFVRAVRIA